MTPHRPPAPGATCVNDVLDDQGTWHPCGLPWDGKYMDADPACPRCREIATLAARALVTLIDAEIAAQQRPDAA